MNDQTSALVTDRVGGIARRRRTAAEALVPTTAALAAMLASEGALAQQAAEASKGTPIKSFATVKAYKQLSNGNLQVQLQTGQTVTLPAYQVAHGADGAILLTPEGVSALDQWVAIPPDMHHGHGHTLPIVLGVVALGGGAGAALAGGGSKSAPPGNPVFSTAAAMSTPEGQTAVGNIFATDPAGKGVTYSITGGADAGDFKIDAKSGALTFKSAPVYDTPPTTNPSNSYTVTVNAVDGTTSASQTFTINVTNVNEPPKITSAATVQQNENNASTGLTVTATDTDKGTVLTYSISGGADAALFKIDPATGMLTWISAPNFEAPLSSTHDNNYALTVAASDGVNTTTQAVTVQVLNVNDNSPYFTSSSSISVPQNVTATGHSVTAADPDGTLNPLTFSITGGPDAALLTVDPRTGAISFKSPPSFTSPMDFNHDNHYLITVSVSDTLHVTSQNLDVQVLAPVGPAISSPASASFAENGTAAALTIVSSDAAGNGGPITYAIEGGADANLFSIDANSGALSFKSSPNYEAPLDAGHNNDYVVNVAAIDKNGTGTQTVHILVTNVNDNAPVLVSPTAISTPEDVTTTGLTVHATDADGTLNPLVYSIVGGPDAALFHLDQNSGVLTWNSAPSFANPLDQGHDNVYNLTVQVTDSKFVTTEDLAVTVTHVNHPPVITSPASVSVNEHITTSVLTVSATDPDAGDKPVFAIAGGPDGALFTIDTTSGALSFKSPPIFEMPQDAGFKNQYHVTVSASDGHGGTVSQAIAVNVLNVNEPPVFTGPTSVSVPSGQVNTGLAITATDNDSGTKLTFSLAGGPDGALFKIDASSGALSFLKAPDFAHPLDQGMDNIYDLTVRVSDGVNGVTETVKVTVTPAAAVAAALSAVPVDPVAATSGAATHSTDVGRPAADTAKAGGTAAVYAITTEVGHVAAPTAADVAAKWVDAFATVADSHAGAAELALVDALHLAAAQPLHDGAHVAT